MRSLFLIHEAKLVCVLFMSIDGNVVHDGG